MTAEELYNKIKEKMVGWCSKQHPSGTVQRKKAKDKSVWRPIIQEARILPGLYWWNYDEHLNTENICNFKFKGYNKFFASHI